MTNVGIFQFASSSIHLATSLEILKNELSDGSDNHYCFWANQTIFPNKMSKMAASIRHTTPKKIKKLVHLADPSVNFLDRVTYEKQFIQKFINHFKLQLKEISNLSELHKLEFEQILPGAAIANEIINYTNDRDVNLTKFEGLIIKLLKSYLVVYFAAKEYLINNKIQKVYVYNGRFLHERAVWDAAKNLKIEVFIFETLRNRFQIRREGFHDRINNQKVMKDVWSKSELELKEKINIGSNWFNDMSSKKNRFNLGENTNFIKQKNFIVYYTSSDEEMLGFWNQWTEPLGTQYECILKLIDIFAQQDEYDLYIKLHPNLINKPKSVLKKLVTIPLNSNSKLILPESTLSTYDLLLKSSGTITIGSTIGIESAFHGRPVLILADSKYDELGIGKKANDWLDVSEWIQNIKNISQHDLDQIKTNACIFGFYYSKAGQDFKYVSLKETSISGAWEAKDFLGVKISENVFLRIYRKIVSKIQIKFF
jgi:hypothetical protein